MHEKGCTCHNFHLICDIGTTLLFSCISGYEIFIQTAVGSAICLVPGQSSFIICILVYNRWYFYKGGKWYCLKKCVCVRGGMLVYVLFCLQNYLYGAFISSYSTPKQTNKQNTAKIYAKIMVNQTKLKGSEFGLYVILYTNNATRQNQNLQLF